MDEPSKYIQVEVCKNKLSSSLYADSVLGRFLMSQERRKIVVSIAYDIIR